ncbi:hypothetical protein QJS66_10245 [Kocuria rhizophila]|nr:hypothetical protein QJS66_10245 [Kocuria rhizophila]
MAVGEHRDDSCATRLRRGPERTDLGGTYAAGWATGIDRPYGAPSSAHARLRELEAGPGGAAALRGQARTDLSITWIFLGGQWNINAWTGPSVRTATCWTGRPRTFPGALSPPGPAHPRRDACADQAGAYRTVRTGRRGVQRTSRS